MNRIQLLALVLAVASLAFHLLTTLVDFFPFNNVRGSRPDERLTEAIVNGIPLLLGIALIAVSGIPAVRWLAWVAVAIFAILAVLGLLLWWLPYLADVTVPWATVPGVTWSELHARTYADTIIVVPPIGDRPRPNLEHMILHALFLGTAVTTLLHAVGRR
jgi:membrane-associated phospholipid phosphatase